MVRFDNAKKNVTTGHVLNDYTSIFGLEEDMVVIRKISCGRLTSLELYSRTAWEKRDTSALD